MTQNEKKESSVWGTVTEALPSAKFRVELEAGNVVIAYLSGRMRINRIKVLVGDRVEIILDAYGQNARIVKRQ